MQNWTVGSRRAYVIGAGLAGLWTAWNLAQEGHEVIIYEAHEPGYGASSRAVGIVSLQLPLKLLGYALEGLRAYKSMGLVRETMSLWIPRPEVFECALSVARELERHGMPISIGTVEELINQGTVNGDERAILMVQAIVDPGDVINALYSKMAAWIVEGSATVRDGMVLVNGRPLDDGPVFIASGPWSTDLLGLRGLRTYRCSAFGVESDDELPGLIVEDDIMSFYYVPEGGRRRGIIAGPDEPLNLTNEGFRVNIYEAYDVLEAASKRMPSALGMRPVSAWAAPCVVAPDGMPAVGEVPGMNNVYVFTGLNGAGLTLAPALSKLLVDAFEGVSQVPQFMRPERLERLNGDFLEPFDALCA